MRWMPAAASVGQAAAERKVERFAARTEDAEPTGAAGRPIGVDIDQIDLVDAKLVAFEPTGGPECPDGKEGDEQPER